MATAWYTTQRPVQLCKRPVPRDQYIAEALRQWCSRPDKSIWWEIIENGQRTGKIFGMSDYFRGGMKPIFNYVYQKLYVEQVSTDLVQNILSDGEGLRVVESNAIRGSVEGYRQMITMLRYIVHYVVETEWPFGRRSNFPDVYHNFIKLCDVALGSWNLGKLRDFSYFICKNPIVFDYRDGMNYFDKCWNLRQMDVPHFDREVKMTDLAGYIYVVGFSHEALYNIKMYGHGIHFNEENYIPPEYYGGPTCFQYFMNVKRHVQEYQGEELNSLQDIFVMIASVFPSVLPTAFYDMTKHLFVENKFQGFATCSHATFIDFLETQPRLL